jgi:hypothetical protein
MPRRGCFLKQSRIISGGRTPGSRGMALSSDGARPPSAFDRVPLWAAALTVGLLALGFTPDRYAGPSRSARHPRAARGRQPQGGRGRSASTPSEIPVRGWKDILCASMRISGKTASLSLQLV